MPVPTLVTEKVRRSFISRSIRAVSQARENARTPLRSLIWWQTVREMGGAPRNLAPRNHFLGVDCQIIRLPLHSWALDKQSFHSGSKHIVECRPHLGAFPLSLRQGHAATPCRRRLRHPRRPRPKDGCNWVAPLV